MAVFSLTAELHTLTTSLLLPLLALIPTALEGWAHGTKFPCTSSMLALIAPSPVKNRCCSAASIFK